MTLLDQIKALPNAAELIAARDLAGLAAAVSVGRTKFRKTALGPGSIIAAIGDLDAANAYLDAINSAAPYRHIKTVINRGDFDMGEPMAQAGVQAMVRLGLLTQAQADSLCALGLEPYPVTERDVMLALYDDAGNLRGGK